jgi:hypothetical protein
LWLTQHFVCSCTTHLDHWKVLAKVLSQFHLQFHRQDWYSSVASAHCRGDRARARAELNQASCPHGSPSHCIREVT